MMLVMCNFKAVIFGTVKLVQLYLIPDSHRVLTALHCSQ